MDTGYCAYELPPGAIRKDSVELDEVADPVATFTGWLPPQDIPAAAQMGNS